MDYYIKATNNRALQDPQGSRYGMSTQYCINDYLVGPATPCYFIFSVISPKRNNQSGDKKMSSWVTTWPVHQVWLVINTGFLLASILIHQFFSLD